MDSNYVASKKQKPGLGAIRPDDWIENRFKDLCEEKNISQTKLFEQIFVHFLRDSREDANEDALPVKADVQLITDNLMNVIELFKGITSKAQNTVIANKKNLELTLNNLKSNLDAETSKNTDLQEKLKVLEDNNKVFLTYKETTDNKITELNEKLKFKFEELNTSKLENAEQLKKIDELKELCSKAADQEKIIENLRKDVLRGNGLLDDKEELLSKCYEKIKGLEQDYTGLNIRKNKDISELENRLDKFNELKLKEMQELQDKINFDYEKKIELLKKELDYNSKIEVLKLREELMNEKHKNFELVEEQELLKKQISQNKKAKAKVKELK